MRLRLHPHAMRMPISRVLSRTTIVSVPTTLKAATTQIRNTTSPMPSFSSFSAENSERFLELPVERPVRIAEHVFDQLPGLGGALRIGKPHFDSRDCTAQPGEILGRLAA